MIQNVNEKSYKGLIAQYCTVFEQLGTVSKVEPAIGSYSLFSTIYTLAGVKQSQLHKFHIVPTWIKQASDIQHCQFMLK